VTERYRTIVADPPWPYAEGFWTSSHNTRTRAISKSRRTHLQYAPLTVKAISALPVSSLAADDAFLFLWTTSRYLADAFPIITAWEFEYRQALIWSKPKDHCLPSTIAPIHAEFLLVAKRGSPPRTGVFPSSVLDATRPKRHSAKPEMFLDYIEQTCPGPYVELFSRRARFGWDYRWHDGDPAPVASAAV
jgi:N6-adenosine-specific RNA methylase IME4